MSPDRFQALADAYGADLDRWPEAERAAAARLRTDWPGAGRVLAEAAAVDEALDAWPALQPSAALRARVLGTASAARARPAGLRLLWPGLGLAFAGAAGALAGAAVVALSPPEPLEVPRAAWASEPVTAFGDLGLGQEPPGQDS